MRNCGIFTYNHASRFLKNVLIFEIKGGCWRSEHPVRFAPTPTVGTAAYPERARAGTKCSTRVLEYLCEALVGFCAVQLQIWTAHLVTCLATCLQPGKQLQLAVLEYGRTYLSREVQLYASIRYSNPTKYIVDLSTGKYAGQRVRRSAFFPQVLKVSGSICQRKFLYVLVPQ
jgi:hypothetical protein